MISFKRNILLAKDVLIEDWDEFYTADPNRQGILYDHVYRTTLLAATIFQGLAMVYARLDWNSNLLNVATLAILYITKDKIEEKFYNHKKVPALLLTASVAFAVALMALGSPSTGLTPLIWTLLTAAIRYAFYQYIPIPVPVKLPEETPKITGMTTHTSLRGRKEIDLPFFLKDGERIADGILVKVDLSNSNFDDRSLNIFTCHLFSKQISCLYPHEIDLSHCPNISQEGIQKLLDRFPKLTLHLSGTRVSCDEVYSLQSDNLQSTLHFDTIGHDLWSLFQAKTLCDVIFTVGSREFPAHSFVLAAFGLDKNLGPYFVEGLSATDFEQVLKNLYQGKHSTSQFKLKTSDKEHLVDLQKIPTPIMAPLFQNVNFSDVTLCFKEQKIPAHKAVLAARNNYFRKMFTTGLKERHAKEVDLTQLPLKSPLAIHLFLNYLYTGKIYDILLKDIDDCVSEIITFADMSSSGEDCLDLIRLLDLRKVRLKNALEEEKVEDLLEAYNSNLWIQEEFILKFFENKYGVLFSFGRDKIEKITLNKDLIPLPLLQSLLVNQPDLIIALHFDNFSKPNKKAAVFDLLQTAPLKAIHLKGTWHDFLELADRQLEKKIEKLSISGKGKIDLSLLQTCENLTSLKYNFGYKTPIETFFGLKKLKKLGTISLAPGFIFTLPLKELPNLTSVHGEANLFWFPLDWKVHSLKSIGPLGFQIKKQAPSKYFECAHDISTTRQFLPTGPLKALNLNSYFNHSLDDMVGRVEKLGPELRSLNLNSTHWTVASLKKILKASPKLVELSLSNIFDQDLELLFQDPSQLEVLIVDSNIDETILQKILQKCPCLRVLKCNQGFSNRFIQNVKTEYPRVALYEFDRLLQNIY